MACQLLNETCTHYLYFTTDDLDAIGPVVKCSPPIRGQEAKDGLWEQVLNGEIDFVTSDHSPCTPDLKIQTMSLMLGAESQVYKITLTSYLTGVQKRGMSLERFAEVICD